MGGRGVTLRGFDGLGAAVMPGATPTCPLPHGPASPPGDVRPVDVPRGKFGMSKLRRSFRAAFRRAGDGIRRWPGSMTEPEVVRLAEAWSHLSTPEPDQADDAISPFLDHLEETSGTALDRKVIRSIAGAMGIHVADAEIDAEMEADLRAGRHSSLGRRIAGTVPRPRSSRPALERDKIAAAAAAGDPWGVAVCEAASHDVEGTRAERYRHVLSRDGAGPREAAEVAARLADLRAIVFGDTCPDPGPASMEGAKAIASDDELARRIALARTVGLTVSRRRVGTPPVRVAPAGGGPAFPGFEVKASMPWPDRIGTLLRDGRTPSPSTLARRSRALAEATRGHAADLEAEIAAVVSSASSALLAIAGRDAGSPHVRGRLDLHLARAVEDAGLGRRALDHGDAGRALGRALSRAFDAAAAAYSRERAGEDLKRRTGLADYAALFPAARAMRRRFVLHVGPTNSGKTHAAMVELAAAGSGAYLAPLRLMAMEGWDRLNAGGAVANLVTGEERIEVPGARHVSSTIETADLTAEVDVAVVDEAQLVLDPDRGWAWTQALFGMPARILHVAGSPDSVAHVARIAAATGEPIEIVRHERLAPLVALPEPVVDIRPGDAVVAFTRADVMRLRASIGRRHRVATIYGALSPEVRRAEARRFRDGEAEVLVATDAIGLGLNLPIRRVLLSTLEKYDGRVRRPLTASEIRQIGGRAGRYGLSERGEVGLLSPASGGAGGSASLVARAIEAQPEPRSDVRLPVMPPWRAVAAVAAELATHDLGKVLRHIAENVLGDDALLCPAHLGDILRLSELVALSGLSLRDRHAYLGCPVDHRLASTARDVRAWSLSHAVGGTVPAPTCAEVVTPTSDVALQACETGAKRLSAYMWLALRFPGAYPEREAAGRERARVNGLIERALARKALRRGCTRCDARLPPERASHLCQACEDRSGKPSRVSTKPVTRT